MLGKGVVLKNELLRRIKICSNPSRKSSKLKNHKTIIFIQLGILFFFGSYLVGMPSSSGDGSETTNPVGLFNSQYLVENLRGDKVNLYKYWDVPQGTSLNIKFLNPRSIPNEYIEVIKNTIVSQETVEIEDTLLHKGPKNSFSTYYVGWKGALEAAGDTKIPIPKKFEFVESSGSDSHIVIILSNVRDSSGYTGYTKTVLEGNQIVKAFITIYDVNSLSKNQLETIMRHEFGHAMGLGHSTAPEDLMAPTIDMTYPYISPCNISAISDLYNENDGGETICEK